MKGRKRIQNYLIYNKYLFIIHFLMLLSLPIIWIGGLILLIIDMVMGTYFSMYLYNAGDSLEQIYIVLLMVFMSTLLMKIGLFHIWVWLLERLRGELGGLEKNSNSQYDKISAKVIVLYRITQILILFLRIIRPFIPAKNFLKIQHILDKDFHFIVENLKKVNQELENYIASSLEDLQGAKGALSKHLNPESQLEAISELQKSRLDRQIEQFEELQKRLIRV